MSNKPEETLDPEDWEAARALAHKMVDDALAHVGGVRERSVWQQMPPDVLAGFSAGMPMDPTPLENVYTEFSKTVTPYAMGNIHPRFWGWFMGAGSFTGALGNFLAAIDGSNLGGGNTAAARVDDQVIDWLKEMMGFPTNASGTLTSGGSMANMVALMVARNARAGVDVRAEGITDLPQPLRFYVSDQAHSAHQKALEALGLGAKSLRMIATGADFHMDIKALQEAIREDRAAGMRPVCVIATAGTTSTGAIDELKAIGTTCKREDMWFHVDGCIGALIRIAPDHRHLVDGIEAADSIALDPHKWLHTPFEAGCVLMRDAALHHASFEMHGEFLQVQSRGVIAGKFLADYSFELSRGFKALKLWMSLKENGVEKFGRLIDQNIGQAMYLTRLVEDEDVLELVAPTEINIVCFRYRGGLGDEAAIKALNTELMLRMQESGVAVPSDTTVNGRHCLRVAIVNHRTQRTDLDLFIAEVLRLGRILEG